MTGACTRAEPTERLAAAIRAMRAALLLGTAWAALIACGSDPEPLSVAYTTISGVPCVDGAVACGDVCVQLPSSAEHCGACGNACAAGEICDVGRCRASAEGCSTGLVLCGSGCFDLSSTDEHCGACDTACPAEAECEASACACPGQLSACGAACVDTLTDSANCGACGQRCLDAQTCESGECRCPPGTLQCTSATLGVSDGALTPTSSEACVDPSSDPRHCGGCGIVCSGGQLCEGGACMCPSEQTLCGDGCVDTATSQDHCGSCGNACADGFVCSAGSCVCPEGQTACDGVCIDTQGDALNCGACGERCSIGEGCSAGSCASGALGEDGCEGLASDVSIAEVAAYQTVKVTLAQDGESVAPEPDMVAGRRSLFRAFVTTSDGWVPRPLSGRLFLENGETATTLYSDILTIEGDSSETDRSSTFEFRVDPELITPETRFALELVECSAATPTPPAPPAAPPPAGTASLSPRYPATDAAELGAIETGGLRVHLVPMRSNGLLPDTSEDALRLFEVAFLDTYPISEIELTVGEPFDIADPDDWGGNLDRLRALRQREAPDFDVYYYGLLKPADSFAAACRNGCIAGVGYIAQPPLGGFPRASMGLAFADTDSAFTMLHEVGHNHGRTHAPCAPGNQIDGVDQNYPQQNGTIGVVGYDAFGDQLLSPNSTDVMGYCQNKWLGAYTYSGLMQMVLTINQARQALVVDPERVAAWRVLLVDPARGVRWGVAADRPYVATGVQESAQVLDAAGALLREVDVYRSEVGDLDAFSIEVPEPEPGWHAIRVAGAAPLEFAPRP